MSKETITRCDQCQQEFSYQPDMDEAWLFRSIGPKIGDIEVHIEVYAGKDQRDLCAGCALMRARQYFNSIPS